jgi:hypothetical protein
MFFEVNGTSYDRRAQAEEAAAEAFGSYVIIRADDRGGVLAPDYAADDPSLRRALASVLADPGGRLLYLPSVPADLPEPLVWSAP